MLNIIKNDWKRMWAVNSFLFTAIALVIISTSAAIFLTNKISLKGNVAIVDEANVMKGKELDPSVYRFTYSVAQPQMSELMLNRYDAVLTLGSNGEITVTTVKNDEFKNMLLSYWNSHFDASQIPVTSRKIGTNILGYMLMFLLMQGLSYAKVFSEDKEKHMIERVSMSPVSFGRYIFSHGIFIFLLVSIPAFLVISAAKIMGFEVGFTLPAYALLIAVASFLSTGFSLCLYSFFNVADTANLLGVSIIVLSTILAGSFYSVGKESSFFNTITQLLPQKDYIHFVDVLEKNKVIPEDIFKLGYVIILSAVLIIIAIYKTRKTYLK